MSVFLLGYWGFATVACGSLACLHGFVLEGRLDNVSLVCVGFMVFACTAAAWFVLVPCLRCGSQLLCVLGARREGV
jgi:hypothetical protein